jgi:hypothetical protein
LFSPRQLTRAVPCPRAQPHFIQPCPRFRSRALIATAS